MASLLVWWLLNTLLAVLALPLTLALFRHLPDRGYPLARILGILLPSFLAWFLGMWQLATYGRALLIFCLLIVALASALVWWKDRRPLHFLRDHWRLVLAYESLFAAALLAGTVLRIYGPWGGVNIAHTEQPMDLAFLNGIVQSRTLPPQDPWLSGYPINYYYLGYLMAASQTLLSGLPSSVTFNLNLASLFALAATACFSLGYNLTLAADPAGRRRSIAVGLLTILLVLLAGNQGGALQVLSGSNKAVALNAGEMGSVLRHRLSGADGPAPLPNPVRAPGSFDTFDQVAPTAGLQRDDFDWWWPSRALWDERPTAEAREQIRAAGQTERALLFGWRYYVSPEQIERSYNITEFPFFSFYLGDMHPHVMGLPLTLLAIALALNVVLASERGRPALGPGRWSWLYLGLNALILGSLFVTNSWDFPSYLLLYIGAWIWRWRKESTEPWTRQDTLALGRDLGLVVLSCLLLYLPFYLTFRPLVGKDIPPEILQGGFLGTVAQMPILSQFFRTVWVPLDKTSLYSFGVIFGLFLYPVLSWMAAKATEHRA